MFVSAVYMPVIGVSFTQDDSRVTAVVVRYVPEQLGHDISRQSTVQFCACVLDNTQHVMGTHHSSLRFPCDKSDELLTSRWYGRHVPFTSHSARSELAPQPFAVECKPDHTRNETEVQPPVRGGFCSSTFSGNFTRAITPLTL